MHQYKHRFTQNMIDYQKQTVVFFFLNFFFIEVIAVNKICLKRLKIMLRNEHSLLDLVLNIK